MTHVIDRRVICLGRVIVFILLNLQNALLFDQIGNNKDLLAITSTSSGIHIVNDVKDLYMLHKG